MIRFLQTTTHGKVLFQLVFNVFVAFGDSAKEQNVVEDLIVEGEVVGGNMSSSETSFGLNLPVFGAEVLN